MNITDLKIRKAFKSVLKLPPVRALLLLVGLWAITYIEALSTAVKQWYISEIYTHGFLVLPVSLFIAWRHRTALAKTPTAPSWLPLPLLVFFTCVGVIGFAGNIYVLSHIAAFASLPLLIWLTLGNRVARVLWFALLFLLFAIPIGDQLIPYLQVTTADMAVAMLSLTDIPIFRTGLYIEIPAGRFVVAEACSGIRFFIGSIVFGSVYAYISFKHWPKRLTFFALSIIIPVVANAFRVFGIILIGHFSDMKHAAGADHLVYGWFFFAVVLLCLILIGENFSDIKTRPSTSIMVDPSWRRTTLSHASIRCLIALLLISLSWKAWLSFSNNDAHSGTPPAIPAAVAAWPESAPQPMWSPVFFATTDTFLRQFSDTAVFRAYYHALSADADLVSSENRFYRPNFWTLVKRNTQAIQLGNEFFNAMHLELTNVNNRRLHIVYWYDLQGFKTGQALSAKLKQTFDVGLGRAGEGMVYAVAAPTVEAAIELSQHLNRE